MQQGRLQGMAGVAKGSGQFGGRTLEEGGLGEGLMREGCGLVCWLLPGQRVEKAKEEDWDEEKVYSGVVIGSMG
jgi:hypothetical protein